MAEAARAGARARTAQKERSQRTRERLADAAIECLVEVGYRGTTFVEVCRRAGLTRGAAHHHYRDIPALLQDVMQRLNERLPDRLRPTMASDLSLEKRIDAAIDALWEGFNAPDFKAAVEIWVAQSHDEVLASRIHSEMQRHGDVVTRGFLRGFPELAEESPEPLEMLRFAFLTLLGQGFLQATIEQNDNTDHTPMLGLLKKVVQREVTFMRMDAATRSPDSERA
jgi:AcrR family transcriptional regulator